jgi:Spy/CpxP family protein refolding chaperone
MKRILIIVSITLIATFALAQEQHRKMMVHGMGPDSGEVAAKLGLSADQKTQWDAIHAQLETSVQPLFDQIAAGHDRLDALASAANPDATAVGTQFLAVRALENQLKAAHESAHAKLTAILTPDQKAKFDALHKEMEHGPMMHMRHPD